MARKDALIFKASVSFGGAGILIGAEHDAATLRHALAEDPRACWTAQQMLDLPQMDFPYATGAPPSPHNMVYGLFFYGDRVNGLMVRGAPASRVVNCTTGAARIGWAMPLPAPVRARFLDTLCEAAE
jgi:hypothetical protein